MKNPQGLGTLKMKVANGNSRAKEIMITDSMCQTGRGETMFKLRRFKIPVFWNMIPCTVGLYKCLEGSVASIFYPEDGAAKFSERSVKICYTTLCHNSKYINSDSIIHAEFLIFNAFS
jgi:hypothetical protein